MQPLEKSYLDELEAIAKKIQASDELEKYLEEEEDEQYEAMKDQYEPLIHKLYERVAEANPLQLIPFEQRLMNDDFEGLFLPRLLGYAVLRGEIDQNHKYIISQEHFQDLLMAICNSPNFEQIKKRIGQSVQIGFALSSDIWITNLIEPIENKKIRYFLQSQKLDKYRSPEGRAQGYKVYKTQFRHFNYMTADFPKNFGELKVNWTSLQEFLIYRAERKLDNSSIMPFINDFIENEDFKGHDEHLKIMAIPALFFDLNEADKKHMATHFNDTRGKLEGFIQTWWQILLDLNNTGRVVVNAEADTQISSIIDRSTSDELTDYYDLMDTVHSVGYVNEEAMEAVKTFYNQHAGRSLVNRCVRQTISNYFSQLLSNLEVREYTELFNASKIYTVYISIFANEKFSLGIKRLAMRYVKLLLKKYTDKRGKDYQDIKRFVSSTFQDLGFLNKKEVVELFKTRRKRKKADA